MTARHHHFLSQCYLKGFTADEADEFVACVDLQERKHFKSNRRNIGGERDFNKIEITGYAPDFLEKAIGQYIEYPASIAIQNVISTGNFIGSDRSIILTLMAYFAVRNPYRRNYWDQLIDHLAKVSLSHAARSEIGAIINGVEITKEFKENYNEDDFIIQNHRHQHIKLELHGINVILPLLFERKWVIVQAPDDLNFISSDYPVALLWKEPEKYHASPGFACRDTQIYFPLSKKMALLGDYEMDEIVLCGSKELVADINSNILQFAHRQVYAPAENFYFRGFNGELLFGLEELWKQIDSIDSNKNNTNNDG